MTLDQLEAVIAVVDCGSFRAAAEHLNRSQPALSLAIKNLEEEFDLLIFDRSAYRPKLTEAGATFLGAAKETMSASQYASRIAKELGTKKAETKLTVSVDPLFSSEQIAVLAKICASAVPPVNLIIEKSILRSSLDPLLKGKIDLAFAPCSGVTEKVETIVLENVTLVGAISRKLLKEKKKITAEVLKAHAQILVYDRAQEEALSDVMSEALKQGPGHKILVPDHTTKLKLIESGVGWGRISRAEFNDCEDVVAIDKNLFPHVNLDLCLMRAKQRALGPIARKIWEVFLER
jgi:DNA-binding transcriptional LysR family regulator